MQAAFVAKFVARHGSVFEAWGVHPRIVRLMRNMHAASWIVYGDLDSAICVRIGGRQGCVFGSMVFNSPYALALMAIRDELLEVGVVLRLRPGDGCPWSVPDDLNDDAGDDGVIVLDVTFVDDECIMIEASSPPELAASIACTLEVVQRIFTLLRLEINWKPGKTECFVRVVGKGASAQLELWRNASGVLAIPVPGCDQHVRVVAKCAHLGSVLTPCGNDVPLARARAKASMEAYGPLSLRVFGALHLPQAIRLQLLSVLVYTRLLFNIHIVDLSINALRIVGRTYNRAMRRVAGVPRFQRVLGAKSEPRGSP